MAPIESKRQTDARGGLYHRGNKLFPPWNRNIAAGKRKCVPNMQPGSGGIRELHQNVILLPIAKVLRMKIGHIAS